MKSNLFANHVEIEFINKKLYQLSCVENIWTEER
jgi:hypothetical protein